MLSGAPGSGKTAVAPGLRRALPGVVVLDLDQFLEAGSRLAGLDLRQRSAADRWPAHNDLCLTYVSAVLAAGHDVLLLSPLTPDEVRRSTAAPALGGIRWAVLDCSDASRLNRLRPSRLTHYAARSRVGAQCVTGVRSTQPLRRTAVSALAWVGLARPLRVPGLGPGRVEDRPPLGDTGAWMRLFLQPPERRQGVRIKERFPQRLAAASRLLRHGTRFPFGRVRGCRRQ